MRQNFAMAAEQPEYEQDPQTVRNHGQITAILNRLRKNRSALTVRVPGNKGDFTSALLRVDSDLGLLQLDELSPQRGHDLIRIGTPIRVLSSASGVETKFVLEVSGIHVEDGIYYYTAPFPYELYYHQRRQHVRVPVPVAEQREVTLRNDERRIQVQLTDLSAGGIGAYIMSGGEVQRGERFDLTMRLRNHPPIEADVEIRFTMQDKIRRRQRFGAQFMGMKPPERLRVERIAVALQRELLRRT